MLRRAFAVFLALHGIAHVLGFLGSWRLAELEDLPYSTLVLNGALDVGDGGIRLVGLLWLAAAVLFVLTGIAVWRAAASAVPMLAVVSIFSLVVCIVGLPASSIGIVIDVALLGAALLLALRPARARAFVR